VSRPRVQYVRIKPTPLLIAHATARGDVVEMWHAVALANREREHAAVAEHQRHVAPDLPAAFYLALAHRT
jgi:hypothetical protein